MRENHAKREFLQDEGSLGLLLMVWGYRIIMLAMVAVGVYVFQMLPITVQSTGAVVALGAYMAMLVVLQDVYRACDIGQAQVSELLMSQLLANLLSMCGIYLGVALYEHQFFPPGRCWLRTWDSSWWAACGR